MIKVYVTKQSNYPVSSPQIKKSLKEVLKDKGIVSKAEISVALVNEEKMKSLSRKYLKDNVVHNVLSFTASEVKDFKSPPDKTMRLGEVVVCYPVALAEAKKEGKLIEEKVLELVEHGAYHLLGIHH